MRGERKENRSPGSFLSAPGLEPKSPWTLPPSSVHLLGETVLAARPSDVLLIILHSSLPFSIAVPGFNLHRHPLLSGSYPAAGLGRPPPISVGLRLITSVGAACD